MFESSQKQKKIIIKKNVRQWPVFIWGDQLDNFEKMVELTNLTLRTKLGGRLENLEKMAGFTNLTLRKILGGRLWISAIFSQI